MPGTTLSVTQDVSTLDLEGQSSLLDTSVRLLTAVPVYTASSVLKLLPASVT